MKEVSVYKRRTAFYVKYVQCWSVGELFWESHLAGRIVPEKCKVKPGRVRVEIKLKKAEPETWNDYEVCMYMRPRSSYMHM